MDIQEILDRAKSDIAHLTDLKALAAVRVSFLGKRGIVTEQLKTLGSLPLEERPLWGTKVNRLKHSLKTLFDEKKTAILVQEQSQKIQSTSIDVTLPARFSRLVGSLHPVTHTMRRLNALFSSLGFDIVHGPEIEDVFHNFTALNIPEHHPARAMHDTFYLLNDPGFCGPILRRFRFDKC